MKKIFSLLFTVILIGLLTGGFLVFKRYRQNPEQIFPYPYTFKTEAPAIKPDAPILITGDRMGVHFSKFSAELAATISTNLAKPIKIQSLAKSGHGLHRTLHDLRSLVQWPQILIYHGASEEFNEVKFDPRYSKVIKKNFSRYQDERIETALILHPWLSRIVYEPQKRIFLEEEPQINEDISEKDYMARLETELLLFEQQLIQLVNLSKDRNTLLILTTTPINLDVAPKRVCEFTSTSEIAGEITQLKKLFASGDIKSAFSTSSRLVQQYPGNAQLFFIHGRISKRLGRFDEARNAFLQASAFECAPWRATAVYNSIIRKVAQNQQVILFDFAKLLENEWANNVTFFDELHPQNLYYDYGMKQLGLVIKQILKL